jgi:hypothetical protein
MVHSLTTTKCDGELKFPITHCWVVGPHNVRWGIKIPHHILTQPTATQQLPVNHIDIKQQPAMRNEDATTNCDGELKFPIAHCWVVGPSKCDGELKFPITF